MFSDFYRKLWKMLSWSNFPPHWTEPLYWTALYLCQGSQSTLHRKAQWKETPHLPQPYVSIYLRILNEPMPRWLFCVTKYSALSWYLVSKEKYNWFFKKYFVHIHNGVLLIEKNTFESVLMRWMKLEPVIQSEVSRKKNTNTVY